MISTTRLARPIHQSYFLVAMSIGIIAGTILALIFHINFFASSIWLTLVALLFVFTYLRPKFVFLTLALIAGFLLAFFRVATVLQNTSSENISLSSSESFQPESWLTDARDHFADRIRSALSVKDSPMGETTLPGENAPLSAQDALTKGTTSPETQDTTPSKESSLGLSYLLGQKSDLDKQVNDELKTIGLVHIVVASGAHLSILVGAVGKIFKKLSRRIHLLFSTLFIILFMALVGFTPSILRAGLMSILALLAGFSGRKIAPWRLILLTAATTLIIDPTFITNLGWLLSFASYTGIMLIGPALTSFFYGGEKPPLLAATLITSLSATLLTLPITLYYFGQFSLLAIPANLLILPTLPAAMGLTFATGLTMLPPIAFITQKILSLHLTLIHLLAEQTPFLITTDKYNPAVFLLYLPVLVPFIIGLIRHKVLKLNKVDKGRNYVRTQ
ncbi:ComEC/Rec2 family competence protein [Candidatus Saccharibacteria bacterium]|nr:ComEC/Rec2 family competence protein [Candidatus Saccharibacteria bacterium]